MEKNYNNILQEDKEKVINRFTEILEYKKNTIDVIEDDEEREIEMSAYFEEMPFEEIELALKIIEELEEELKNMKKKVKDFNDLYETINNVIETNNQTEINQLVNSLNIEDLDELIDLEIETKEKK